MRIPCNEPGYPTSPSQSASDVNEDRSLADFSTALKVGSKSVLRQWSGDMQPAQTANQHAAAHFRHVRRLLMIRQQLLDRQHRIVPSPTRGLGLHIYKASCHCGSRHLNKPGCREPPEWRAVIVPYSFWDSEPRTRASSFANLPHATFHRTYGANKPATAANVLVEVM